MCNDLGMTYLVRDPALMGNMCEIRQCFEHDLSMVWPCFRRTSPGAWLRRGSQLSSVLQSLTILLSD